MGHSLNAGDSAHTSKMARSWWQSILLVSAVLACVAQRADSQLPDLRVRIQLCQPSGRDVCGKRTAKVTFAPARVRIEVYSAYHPDNRAVIYGISCAGEEEPRTESEAAPVAAMHFNETPNFEAGECYASAALVRVKNGVETILRAKDGPIQILSRLED
jgi:hypothetical protein